MNQEKMNIEKKEKFIDLIMNNKSMKESNFEEIHLQYKDSKEISFIDSLSLKFKIEKKNLSLKEIIESKLNEKKNLELIMIHRESRKIYYLFLYDRESDEKFFIMKNDSIMKNKIYSLKFSQFFNLESILIHYIKNDRKNQSKEIISKDSSDYQKLLNKYSMI